MLKSAKNWITAHCKFASVTFSPAGSYKVSRPKDLEAIASEMARVGHDKGVLGKIDPNEIMADGLETGKFTGTINVYLSDKESATSVRALVEAFNLDQAGTIEVVLSKVERSKSTGGLVARVEVARNETAGYEEVPEANMANGNARMVLELLSEHGLPVDPKDLMGSFTVDDYWLARNLVSEEAKRRRLREPSDKDVAGGLEEILAPGEEQGPKTPWEKMERDRETPWEKMERERLEKEEKGKVRVVDQGMTEERIERYFSALDGIAKWIERQKLPDRTISFG
jgi:hypothetical protein